MPVRRRTYLALQARYELALEQRDTARTSLTASRSLCASYAEEIEKLRDRAARPSTTTVTTAEHARLKAAYTSLEQQLCDVQASNEEMARQARENAEAAL
ncbi:hypothetical protein OG393_21145 [Streptomyces sp. NBC_01216]|uniref:hypothetical protein n=1 Tax=Streptomyces sp. NBC_01216 TaxID=2903778 RepID=UPI002E13D51B|nr:hypothetical protein OG393_21145 [Streptomyces sp. NBC_01216]